MKKHLARLTNTDQRVVVAFMQIPDRPDHALVISVDNLPDRFEQALMDVVESAEGQSDPVLANVLCRHLVPDTGQNLMEALHAHGYMRAVHVDQVAMYPEPNMPFPLRQIIEGMGKAPPAVSPDFPVQEKFNPHTHNSAIQSQDDRRGIARNLLAEANLLMEEAGRKQRTAYGYAPDLDPTNGPAKGVAKSEPKAKADKPADKPADKARAKPARTKPAAKSA